MYCTDALMAPQVCVHCTTISRLGMVKREAGFWAKELREVLLKKIMLKATHRKRQAGKAGAGLFFMDTFVFKRIGYKGNRRLSAPNLQNYK